MDPVTLGRQLPYVVRLADWPGASLTPLYERSFDGGVWIHNVSLNAKILVSCNPPAIHCTMLAKNQEAHEFDACACQDFLGA